MKEIFKNCLGDHSKGVLRPLAADEGVTFIEVLVTFVMLVAAIIITFHSLFISNHALDLAMRKEQVLQIVQNEMEYWIGRIYVGSPPTDPNLIELGGQNHYKMVLLDPNTDKKVEVWLSRDPIVPRQDIAQPGEGEQKYWVITIYAEWNEPGGQEFKRGNDLAISLTTYVSQPG